MAVPVIAARDARRGIISRRMPREYSKQANAYAKQVGRILWAYNRLHGQLSIIFAALVTPDRRSLAAMVWHALKADSAQRDILQAAILERSEVPANLAEAVEWLVNVCDKLSTHRNDPAHTPMTAGIDFVAKEIIILPDLFAANPQKAARLSRKDLALFHRRLEGDLLALGKYAEHVNVWISMWHQQPQARQPPLPYRPRLQAIPPSEIPPTRSQKDRLRKKEGRRAQQRSLLPKAPKLSKAQRRKDALARRAPKNGK